MQYWLMKSEPDVWSIDQQKKAGKKGATWDGVRNYQAANNLKKMIISPCISICKTDPQTGYCYGCARNNEEKKMWKMQETTEEWKKSNLTIIQTRLSGWQLESFKESYDHKIENGISLYKKNLNNE